MTSRLAVLSENGLPDKTILSIEPHKQGLGKWRIKFSFEGSEPLSMSSAQASEMASHLFQIGEADMAEELNAAVKRAERYQLM